jgi:L-alanine-DL-glutamate epimerase-like enolase superfamily enzyme
MHLLASQPIGHYAEYHSWWNAIYVDPPRVSDGLLKIGPKPGYGLELDRKAIARCRLD